MYVKIVSSDKKKLAKERKLHWRVKYFCTLYLTKGYFIYRITLRYSSDCLTILFIQGAKVLVYMIFIKLCFHMRLIIFMFINSYYYCN